MTENPDKLKDESKIKESVPTPEVVLKASAISDTANQARWQRAQDVHKLGQLESATDLFYDPNWKKLSTEKFELFDGEASRSPDLDSNDMPPPEALLAGGPTESARNFLLDKQIVRVAQPMDGSLLKLQAEKVAFPFRGQEDVRLAQCSQDNPKAWSEAFEAFPSLKNYLSAEACVNLMRALVRNELHHYDPKDGLGDMAAKLGLPTDETLGYAQITSVGVKDFEKRYPQLARYLAASGYEGQEGRALQDPKCVPMIVAAKLMSEVDVLKHAKDVLRPGHAVEINVRSLAYTYNADVYYKPFDRVNPDFHSNSVPKAQHLEKVRGYVKAYPTSDESALRHSAHLANIEGQYKLLK